MQKLLIATTNPGKRKEIIPLLSKLEVHLCTPADLQISLTVEENADSYAGNASLKAQAWCQASGLLTFADDTGLEVAALDGAPGLHSARFTGSHSASDLERRSLLLKNLGNKLRPWQARFVCSVAIADISGKLFYGNGECQGEIIPEQRGFNGFGYDPIFLIHAMGKTMAECTLEEKNKISHRAMAVRDVLPKLSQYLQELKTR